MPETRGQKRAAIESLNPLYYPDILSSVLNYAGPEQWLFLGLVSRKWAAAYRKVPPATRETAHILCEEHEPPCVTITSRMQAFASASRVKFADKHGLGWPEPSLYCPFANGCNEDWRSGRERELGRLGSLEALQQAKQLGWRCSSYVALGAAQSHCLPKLQWLLNTVVWMHDEI
eukprot:5889-Heterococcus_DN1.PRE.2